MPDYTNTVGHSVKRLYQLMDQRFNDVLRPHGVARSQWYVLYHLHSQEPISQKELQQLFSIEAATLTGMIDPMVRKGWLTRTPSVADRRVKELWLTAAGRALWKRLPDPILEVRQVMLQGISEQEEQWTRDILDRAIENLRT